MRYNKPAIAFLGTIHLAAALSPSPYLDDGTSELLMRMAEGVG